MLIYFLWLILIIVIPHYYSILYTPVFDQQAVLRKERETGDSRRYWERQDEETKRRAVRRSLREAGVPLRTGKTGKGGKRAQDQLPLSTPHGTRPQDGLIASLARSEPTPERTWRRQGGEDAQEVHSSREIIWSSSTTTRTLDLCKSPLKTVTESTVCYS